MLQLQMRIMLLPMLLLVKRKEQININGITRDMTEVEIAELETLAADMPEPEKDPTEARLDEIEAGMIELANLIGGE